MGEGNVIRFFARDVYGVTKFYATDKAYEIETLSGQKTLTARTFSAMESLGFRFEEVLDPERGMSRKMEEGGCLWIRKRLSK